MRLALTIAAVLFGIPLLFFAYMYATSGKVVIVRNAGAETIRIAVWTSQGAYFEHSDEESLAPGKLTWQIIHPKLDGTMRPHCVDAKGLAVVSLGAGAQSRMQWSSVTLNSCSSVASRSGFGF